MKKNNELFELCKQVYEATGWESDKLHWMIDTGSPVPFVSLSPGKKQAVEETDHPIYTSDYLLEKLPVYSEDAEGMLSVTTRQGQERNGWMAYYEDIDGYSVGAEGIGKSPLEAILRLTLKLHEERLL